jgi:hypothetical protein
LPEISRGSQGRCGHEGEGRGTPERRVDGEVAQTTSGGDVRRRGGGSGGWRWWGWGPAAPKRQGVRKLQEIAGIGSSGRSSTGSGGRRWSLAGIREGDWAIGGRRRRSRCGERWGGSGAREEGSERNGDGRMSGAARAGSERLDGSATEGKRGGKRWGSGRGGATQRGGVVGPGPDRRTAPGSGPSTALTSDVRHTRVASGNREGREAFDGWAAAQ